MSESRLKPEEVASLDPYNTRESAVTSEAKDLLGDVSSSKEAEVEVSKPESPEKFRKELVYREGLAWQEMLGSDKFTVWDPPELITQNIEAQLNKSGLQLRYIPDLDFLRDSDPVRMEEKFPNWRRFESLLPAELGDWRNKRNLPKEFWESVRKGKMSTPDGGYWIAVEEGIPDVSYQGRGYMEPKEFALSSILGVTARRSSYLDVQRILSSRGPDILHTTSLPLTEGIAIRVPTALEYNLLMNRDHINSGQTDLGEWTSTELKTIFGKKNLVMGFKSAEGASEASEKSPGNLDYYNRGAGGFRIVIDFPQPKSGIEN